jgi:lysophospholipase L1-like esterase
MIIEPNSKLVMIGDSITDCERACPIGEGLFGALGKGYVSLVDACLTARYPAQRIRVINMGISGNTVRDLQSRWQRDVLDLRPDWLSICIGINDVWHHFDLPNQAERPVPLHEYTQTLDDLLRITRPSLKGLILMTPYFIEPNRSEPMRILMDQYGTAVRKLAETYDAQLVDTQAAFDAVLADLHPMALAWDRVHPTQAGHMILALAFLETLGYKLH